MTSPRWELVATGSGEVRDQNGNLLSFEGMYEGSPEAIEQENEK